MILTLSDGTEIEGLTAHPTEFGDTIYTSDAEVDADVYTDNLDSIALTDDDGNETALTDQKLMVTTYGDAAFAFWLEPKSPRDKEREALEAKLDYIAMMADIDLEE